MNELFTLFTEKVKALRSAQDRASEFMAKCLKDPELFRVAYDSLKEERKLEQEVDQMINEIEALFIKPNIHA